MTDPVLLLSGAGLPAWIWDGVRAGLQDRPSVVFEPPRGRASLAEYATAALEQAPADRFAIVAHSAGGVVAAELLSQAPQRLAGVLGVSAVVPTPGRSFAATVPAPARMVLPLLLRVLGTRPPEAAVRKGLAAGLPQQHADRIVADLAPESRRLFLDRTSVRRGGRGVPAGYLRTTADPEMRPALQQRCATTLGARWTVDVDGAHMAPLERPQAVLQALTRLLNDVQAPSRATAARPDS